MSPRKFIILLFFTCLACGPDRDSLARTYAQARTDFLAGRMEPAAQGFGAIYTADPEFRDAAELYGRTLFHLRRYSEAVRVFEGREEFSYSARVWLARAQAELPEGRKAALATLESILTANPGDVDSWHFKARLHLQGGERQEALAAVRKVMKKNLTFARSAAMAARIYSDLNLPQQADEARRIARQLAPEDPIVRAAETPPATRSTNVAGTTP